MGVYVRKTKDVWKIMAKLGYGQDFEVVDTADSYHDAEYLFYEYKLAYHGCPMYIHKTRERRDG